MALTSKQKKVITIIGHVWKVLSAVAIVFIFVITTSGNIGATAADLQNTIKNHSIFIEESSPKMLEFEKTINIHDLFFSNIQQVLEEQKKINHDFQITLTEQVKLSALIQQQLQQDLENKKKFWSIDWKALQDRLERIENKLDGIH